MRRGARSARRSGSRPGRSRNDPLGHRPRDPSEVPGGERGSRLAARLGAVPPDEAVAVSIVTVEEQMRGWLAAIAKERQARRQVVAYAELARLFEYFRAFVIVPFDEAAADRFDELRSAKLQLGAMDLKIAAVALARNALLLSANRRHFEGIPGLRVENWLN